MNISKSLIACAIAASLVTGAYAVAASSDNTELGMSSVGAPMAWPERKALITTVVHKWSAYVQQSRGIKPQVWARSMGATFAAADPANFRRAATMTTYEGMIATLLGQKTTDAKIIDTLARNSSAATLAALASPASELVYTMVQPCRIIDTRVINAKMGAGEKYDYEASRPGGSFTSQGGDAGDCGMPADPAAVVMNVTVVAPEGSGFLAVWPYGTPMPNTSSNNYSIGRNTGNEIIVRQTIGDAADFSMYANRNVHVVADVVGYFAAPTPHGLDVTVVNGPIVTVLTKKSFTSTATCPSGYTATGGGGIGVPRNTSGFISESYPGLAGGNWTWTITGHNTTKNSMRIRASVVCARS